MVLTQMKSERGPASSSEFGLKPGRPALTLPLQKKVGQPPVRGAGVDIFVHTVKLIIAMPLTYKHFFCFTAFLHLCFTVLY